SHQFLCSGTVPWLRNCRRQFKTKGCCSNPTKRPKATKHTKYPNGRSPSPSTIDHCLEVFHQFRFAVKIYLPGLAPFTGPHYPKILQLIHDSPGPIVTEFQFPLKHGCTAAVIDHYQPASIGEQLIQLGHLD